jgi:geranylgeranyl diphosphate synthase, type II
VNINEYFKGKSALVDKWLDRLLPAESENPTTIHQAMRYSVFAGGKRLRPILTIASGEIFGASEEQLLPAACAIEMIHTYSLVHDDLPAMDDDDMRRGRATNHVVYGEAMAILAGDALLTQAFRTLADYRTVSAENKIRVISEVAKAAGTTRALIGGQVLDIQSEGKKLTADELEDIHRAKTGALMTCAIRIGAIIGGANDDELTSLTAFGQNAGLSFQIADDLLDQTATSEELGKTPGKDLAHRKATYAAHYGMDRAREMAYQLTSAAVSSVSAIGRDTRMLQEIARFIIERRY